MKRDLHGKRALVTGASSGIGRATAEALAKEGVRLAVAGRQEAQLTRLAHDIAAAGGERPVVLSCDLSKPGAAEELARRALSALGGMDLLINNAGVSLAGPQIAVGDTAAGRDLFETNFWSPLALVRALAPSLIEAKGAVVNVASMASVVPSALMGHYSASKAALAMATETLRQELGAEGVHVVLVLPGPVDTGMLAEARAVPSVAKALRFSPRGNAPTLAKRIVNAIRKERGTIIYPRSLWFAYLLPDAMRRLSALVMSAPVGNARVLRGGSQGDPEMLAIRSAHHKDLRTGG
jgi:short-subunit dehydrogenase